MCSFGATPAGEPVRAFTLTRDAMEVEVIEYGASLRRVRVPDREGLQGDVVLSLATMAAYWEHREHFGAVPGRFANRIAGGRFELDGRRVALARNHGRHHLHGGERGFGRRVWSGEVDGEDAVRLTLVSEAGDEGYPGRVRADARYALAAGGVLEVALRAETDAPTVVNLTQHAYFHLGDGGGSPVLDHRVQVAADSVLEIDDEGIPTGKRLAVAGTPFDLREPAGLSDRVRALSARGGFDHCFVLSGDSPAARVHHPGSGRTLAVETDRPGLQLYTGNALDGRLESPSGFAYGRWHGLCLEAQDFPDAPNQGGFPSVRLDPRDEYRSRIRFHFGVEPR